METTTDVFNRKSVLKHNYWIIKSTQIFCDGKVGKIDFKWTVAAICY